MFSLAAFIQSYDKSFKDSFLPAPPSHPDCGPMSCDLIASPLDYHGSNGLPLVFLPQSLLSPVLYSRTFCDDGNGLYLPCPVQ